MGSQERIRATPLQAGFYTAREAARILHIPTTQKVVAWLTGRSKGPGPVIIGQYARQGGPVELGFLDLIEIRFVEYFRQQGVSLQSIRKAAAAARTTLGSEHPFALSSANAAFVTDRRNIFLETAESNGDKKLLEIVGRQYAMYEMFERALAAGIRFDPHTELAARWYPEPEAFPRILLDPRIAFGHPAIAGLHITTDTLYGRWRVEGGDFEAVADWFEVPIDDVRQAVEYELALAA